MSNKVEAVRQFLRKKRACNEFELPLKMARGTDTFNCEYIEGIDGRLFLRVRPAGFTAIEDMRAIVGTMRVDADGNRVFTIRNAPFFRYLISNKLLLYMRLPVIEVDEQGEESLKSFVVDCEKLDVETAMDRIDASFSLDLGDAVSVMLAEFYGLRESDDEKDEVLDDAKNSPALPEKLGEETS